ncbi:MAG: Ig-like domain-containing protein [Paludibacteraceae bacterium]|nr:Ig-like domain-containing protein [Paludibacteraceae bacterium]
MKKLLFFVLAAITLAACNGGKGGNGEFQSAELSKSTLEMSEGQEVRLTVVTTPEDVEFDAVWSSDNEMIASVSENGTVYANAVGSATITAEVTGTNGVKDVATCQVTVKSILDATVFDRAAVFAMDKDNMYDYVYEGKDTTIVYKTVNARYMLLPSTMYIDGDGYMAGDGGYILAMETAFFLGMSENGEIQSMICLGDYKMIDNIDAGNNQRVPFAFQGAHFNKDTYEAYITAALMASNGQGEKPDPEQYPYYQDLDSYFLRGFVTSNGLAYVDAGFPALGDASGIVEIMHHPENEKWQAPVYYDFNAKIFGNPGNYGLAIEEKEGEEGTYVFVDKNGDQKFDMAEMTDYHFNGGKPSEETAAAPAIEMVKTPFGEYGAVPAPVVYKNMAIDRTLHVALCLKANIK